MTRHGIPVLISSTLALLLGGASAQAGSWFGPGPYGASYRAEHDHGFVGVVDGDGAPLPPPGPSGPPVPPGLYGGRCPFIWDWTYFGYYPYYYSEPSNYLITSHGPMPVVSPPLLLAPPPITLPIRPETLPAPSKTPK